MPTNRTTATIVWFGSLLYGLGLAHPPVCAAEPQLEIKYIRRAPDELPTIRQIARDVPVVAQADVVVAGGGVAGVAAALKAAAEGRSVVIVEERNHFGYELADTLKCTTAALQSAPAYPLAESICKNLVRGGFYRGEFIRPAKLKPFLNAMVRKEPKITVYLYSMPTGVVIQGNMVRGLVMVNRSGRQVVLAKSVIDATGDARIAAAAGARFHQPLTGQKTFVRFATFRSKQRLQQGVLDVPENMELHGNSLAIHNDGTNQTVEFAIRRSVGDNAALDLAHAQADTLKMTFDVVDYLDRHWHKTRTSEVAPRRTLRDDLVTAAEMFLVESPVVVCRATFTPQDIQTLDIGNPDAMRPEGVDGLVIAGRAVSTAKECSDLQTLLCLGEEAGRVASEASALQETPIPASAEQTKANGSTGTQGSGSAEVREILTGPDPSVAYRTLHESAVDLPVIDRVDVLVIGGGTSGAPAAISAARQGVKVAVVEILPQLGGTGTTRVQRYYWGVHWRSELRDDIDATIGVFRRHKEKYSLSGQEKMRALQDLFLKEGGRIYYRTLGAAAVVDAGRVAGVVIEGAGGRQVILAKVVIDTTGHADIAAAAGADFAKGRTGDGLLNEMDGHGIRDPTNVEDISRFTMKMPPSSIGLAIRESRRIIGDHVLTFDEAIHGKRFPDVVCKWRSNYDTHFRHSAGESELSQNWATIMGLFRKAIEGGIPYRSLTPKGLDNILVAGKAYSVTHDALLAARMQPDMQHLGEAAGVAAAMASRLGVSVRDVPIRQLQSELVELGVLRQQDLDELLQKPPAYDLDNAARLLGTEDALQGMVALYLSGEQAISALRPLLEERNADIRLEAGLVLGMLGDDSAAPVLLDCLNQKNGRTFVYEIPGCSSRLSVPAYYSAVILLGRLRVKTAVPLMIEMLQDPQTCPADLASYTIEALEQIGDPAAAPAIRPYLRFTKPEVSPWENEGFEATWGVRLNAAKALASLDDLSGVPVLIELLDSDLALVRDYAQRLLGQITGRRFGKGDQTGRH